MQTMKHTDTGPLLYLMAIAIVLAPLITTTAQGQDVRPPVFTNPSALQDALLPGESTIDEDLWALIDTSDAAIKRQEALLHRARLARQQRSRARFLPQVQFTFTTRNQQMIFLPAANDFRASAPQWPSDTWTITFTWSLTDLLNPAPLRQARVNEQIREIDLERVRQRRRTIREQEAQQQTRDLERLTLEINQLRERDENLAAQERLRQRLLALVALRYENGEVDFETYTAQQLALLNLQRQRLDVAHRKAQLQLRHKDLTPSDSLQP